MLEIEQKPQNLSEQQGIIRDEQGKFIPGVSGNPGGRPVGSLDFKTKWLRFIDKVAKQNNISPDEVDEQLLAVAFKQAKEANYPFWRDIQDRVHGKPTESLILGGEVISKVIKLDE